MRQRIIVAAILLLALVIAAAWYARRQNGGGHYTGFVEGEERVLRSEVTGKVLVVAYAEGDAVPPNAVVAQIVDDDIRSRIAAKRQQIAVQIAEIRRQEEQVKLAESTWKESVGAHRAEVRQAEAAARLTASTHTRERALVATGASTAQTLDETRSARDQANSGVERARDMLARSLAEEGAIAVARQQLDVVTAQRDLALAELAELEVTHAKYTIHAPAVVTTVQTQYIWPGELAQPGTAILSVLDPTDKYVQVYVPVVDLDRFRLGQRVEIELDSQPGTRVPGEVTFIADQATFTPEKIESRSDRLGQVYRAKVRILEGVERLQPGTEGNVYLVVRDGAAPDRPTDGAAPDHPPRGGAADDRAARDEAQDGPP